MSKTVKAKGQGWLFPLESDWKAPTSLPDLRGKIRKMAIDTEGKDNGLTNKHGSGWPTRGPLCHRPIDQFPPVAAVS